MMENISLEELFNHIEAHLQDVLDYRIDIVEKDCGEYLVVFKDNMAEKKLQMDDNSIFSYIYESFLGRYENVSIIKVRPVFSGDFIYMIIGKKICILFKSNYEEGQKWLTSLVNEK